MTEAGEITSRDRPHTTLLSVLYASKRAGRNSVTCAPELPRPAHGAMASSDGDDPMAGGL